MKVPHFARLIFEKAAKREQHHILYYKDTEQNKWVGMSWRELADKIQETACALIEIGVKEHDNIAIYSQNKPENIIVDFANFAVRAASVPIYATQSASQIDYIINDAEVSTLFVGEQQQYDNALQVIQTSKFLKRIVVFDNQVDLKGEPRASYFSDFIKTGNTPDNNKIVEKRKKAATETDLAVLMYTSGTTGEPKGVMLPHSCILEAMRIHDIRLTSISRHDKSVSFLPLSHVFERGWTYFCFFKEVKIYLNLHPSDIQQTIKEVRPTVMCSVPRFWEKVAIGVHEKIEEMPAFQKGLVAWSVAIGKSYNIDYLRLKKHPPLWLWLRYQIANMFIFNKLKKTVGIENGNLFPTAGAAMDEKLIIFFRSLGIPIVYGYGLTETFATVCCFNYTDYKFGSLGELMPDIEVKIGDDNEILVKGKTVTSGYYKKPEITQEAFINGWFRTGDAGKLDGRHLILIDRIKDLFKTSNGKYIAPQQIETKLGADPYIEQIAVIGNNRNFVTAIIAPAMAPLKAFAQKNNIRYDRIEDLLENEQVYKLYEQHIAESQKDMAKFEQIKKFRLIKKAFSIESGELTSTLKLRRAVILHNYQALIDEMYDNTIKNALKTEISQL
jgi:long-chain acyl-CoA synthetase